MNTEYVFVFFFLFLFFCREVDTNDMHNFINKDQVSSHAFVVESSISIDVKKKKKTNRPLCSIKNQKRKKAEDESINNRKSNTNICRESVPSCRHVNFSQLYFYSTNYNYKLWLHTVFLLFFLSFFFNSFLYFFNWIGRAWGR